MSSRFSSHSLLNLRMENALRIEKVLEEVPIAEAIDEEVAQAQEEKSIFIDYGLPIPEGYDMDTIQALVQDPFHVWVYWSLRDATIATLNALFTSEIVATFYPVLKISETTLGHTAYIGVGKGGSYWLSVFPDRRYRIEIGLKSEIRGYIRLLEADEVFTPRGTVSSKVAEESDYQVSTEEFSEVLHQSGFASFTSLIGPERVLSQLPEEVADVISTASAGEELSDEQLAGLPPRIRALLLEMKARGEGDLASLSLLHLLPEYLRESLSEDASIVDPLHPSHLSPRFMVGSSEEQQRPRVWHPTQPTRPQGAPSSHIQAFKPISGSTRSK
ncbi:MAG: DUF4912 domain-containing protein [Blastocatellia bacterium]|nr:DUF4912 domain-containing protein [Blastocatellia bacterium]